MRKLTASVVQATTTTAGTGALVLAAQTGWVNPADRFANNDLVEYSLRDGNNWEWGQGTWTTGNNFARTTVKGTLSGGVYSGSNTPLTLSGGTTTFRAVVSEELFSTLWKIENVLKGSNFAAADGFAYGITAINVTATLSAAPAVGDRIRFYQAAASITGTIIDPNGAKINAVTGTMAVDLTDFSFSLVYVSAGYGWKVDK